MRIQTTLAFSVSVFTLGLSQWTIFSSLGVDRKVLKLALLIIFSD